VQTTPGSDRLLTKEFIAINVMIFLTYCNIAVFFTFHQYLGTLPIPAEWFGTLIGLFSVTGLVIRPFISPLLHPGNAKPWIAVGCAVVIGSLLGYSFATDLWTMALIRTIHGLGYVVLGTALLSRLVACIPKERSAQAFGLMAVITLLPYAVIPPVLGPFVPDSGGFIGLMRLSALAMGLIFPLLLVRTPTVEPLSRESGQPIGFREVLDNLKNRRLIALFVISCIVWTTFTPVFYFLKDYGISIGIRNPGWFFTLSTASEIGVRLFAGRLLDKGNKFTFLAGSLAWVSVVFVAMAHLRGEFAFHTVAILLGLGWGVVMPVLNALVFDVSESRYRALNTNLAVEMFQLGCVAGPVMGGAIVAQWSYPVLYYACAGLMLAGIALALPYVGQRVTGRLSRPL
jgi:predicted MFS family arabinose efflux permease